MNIEVGQIYTSKLRSTAVCSDYIIKICKFKKSIFDLRTVYVCEIIGGYYGHWSYIINLSKRHLLKHYDYSERLTNEDLIKEIIE